MLIFVCGSVGAGKTTLAKYLLRHLSSKQKTCYQSITAFPLFSYVVYKLLSTLLYGCNLVRAHEKIRIHPATLFVKRVGRISQPLLITLVYIEAMSVFLTYVKMRLVCRKAQVIVIDEGPLNIMANYFEIFDKTYARWLIIFLLKLVRHLERTIDVKTIFLHVSSKSALLRRWTERGHPLSTTIVDFSHLIRYNAFIELSEAICKQAGHYILEIDTCRLEPENTLALVVKELRF